LNEYDSLTAIEKAVMDDIVRLINDEKLGDVVTAFPLNNQTELAAAYRVLAKRGSVFALTALYEPFGLAPLEAMSCGMPVIVTKNGGPSESMVEGDQIFGVLVDPEDPEDIANKILQVILSRAKWNKLSELGVKRVNDKYTWDRTAESYLSVIDNLLKRERSHNQIDILPWFNDPSPENEIPIEILSDLYFR